MSGCGQLLIPLSFLFHELYYIYFTAIIIYCLLYFNVNEIYLFICIGVICKFNFHITPIFNSIRGSNPSGDDRFLYHSYVFSMPSLNGILPSNQRIYTAYIKEFTRCAVRHIGLGAFVPIRYCFERFSTEMIGFMKIVLDFRL